ncbi:hypothetical protein [Methanobrevibacter sp.]|nr:hypothetical protein [Methanobrevibacter sp.]MBQ2832439.1 hypothetical protein [Methanobrevibacter sp.]
MKKWTIILIAIIIILLILIVVLNNYDASPASNNFSDIETQMRKLWY